MPELIAGALSEGVVGRATKSGLVDLSTFNPRDHAKNAYGQIDDKPFGGSPGMLMMPEPLAVSTDEAKQAAKPRSCKTIYLSAQGERLTQSKVKQLAQEPALILVAGRYEGVDERYIEEYVDEEISIGDYVVSGGELPALLLLDAIVRLLDGSLSNAESSIDDSFNDNLLEGPQFTRPQSWRGKGIPEVLASGNHVAIENWRREQALLRTWQRRPDMLVHADFSTEDRDWLRKQQTQQRRENIHG